LRYSVQFLCPHPSSLRALRDVRSTRSSRAATSAQTFGAHPHLLLLLSPCLCVLSLSCSSSPLLPSRPFALSPRRPQCAWIVSAPHRPLIVMAENLARIYGTEEDKINCPFYFKVRSRASERAHRQRARPLRCVHSASGYWWLIRSRSVVRSSRLSRSVHVVMVIVVRAITIVRTSVRPCSFLTCTHCRPSIRRPVNRW
jgi:hypothetical protein